MAALLLDPATAIAAAQRAALALGLATALCALWLLADARQLPSGDPVALKPLKFLLSFTVHMATLAWIGALTERAAAGDRMFAGVVHVQMLCVLVELAAITIQAARGVESHFNYATAFDRAIFTAMGLGVLVLALSFAAMLIGLARRPAGPPLALLATRLGVAGMFAGFAAGALMVQPTPDQAAVLTEGARPAVIGSHGPTKSDAGAPLLGWSYETADWRAAHFLGVHAFQALPLFAVVAAMISQAAGARAQIFFGLAGLYGATLLYTVLRTLDDRSALAVDPAAGPALAAALGFAALVALIGFRAAPRIPLRGASR